MRKSFLLISFFFFAAVPAFAMSFNQSWANPGHKQAFAMVMDGLSGENFTEVCKAVSSAADEKCMAYYREIGMMKGIGNHRFMGHWGWSADIPQEVFERGAKMTPPVSKDAIVSVWQRIHKETVELVIDKTGLPPKAADAFAGLLYDTHLLHDYTGEFAKALQNPDAIQRDAIRNLHRILGNRSTFVRDLEIEINNAIKGVTVAEDKSRIILNVFLKKEVGKEIYKVYGERFLSSKGIAYIGGDVSKLATGAKAVNEQFFIKSLSGAIKDCGQRVDGIGVERVVRGVYSEIEKNGKKAYRLQIPLQFSTEDRIASQYAKECLTAANGSLSEEKLSNLVAERLRDLKGNGAPEQIQRTASNAAKWAKMNSDKLAVGVKAGILTFCITEGITVVTFAETDMDEEEFWRQTEKNLGGAILQGTATYVLVALGANPFTWPGGLIVLGVGIGTQIVYDFAWNRLQRYLDSLYFSLDDFIGDLPEEIKNRTNVLTAFEFAQFETSNQERLSTIDYLLQQEARDTTSPFLPNAPKHSSSLDYRGEESPIDKPVRHGNAIDFLEQPTKENHDL